MKIGSYWNKKLLTGKRLKLSLNPLENRVILKHNQDYNFKKDILVSIPLKIGSYWNIKFREYCDKKGICLNPLENRVILKQESLREFIQETLSQSPWKSGHIETGHLYLEGEAFRSQSPWKSGHIETKITIFKRILLRLLSQSPWKSGHIETS